MLDADLSRLYGVTVGRLNEAVKRKRSRFPEDFMFQLTKQELEEVKFQTSSPNLISQIAISSSNWGGRRHPPRVFTEQGVAMLSSVLNSERAVQVNIAIMRAFVKLRQILEGHRDLARKLEALEGKYDAQFKAVFDVIRKLMVTPEPLKRRKIGFHAKGVTKIIA